MASYTGVTVTEADAFRALVAWFTDAMERAIGSGTVQGMTAASRPIMLEGGFGAPWPDVFTVPRLVAPNTVSADEKTKLADYAQCVCRWFKAHMQRMGISESIVVANCAVNANVNTQMTATRAEQLNIMTAYNAAIATLQGTPANANITQLATPPALA